MSNQGTGKKDVSLVNKASSHLRELNLFYPTTDLYFNITQQSLITFKISSGGGKHPFALFNPLYSPLDVTLKQALFPRSMLYEAEICR